MDSLEAFSIDEPDLLDVTENPANLEISDMDPMDAMVNTAILED